ncbi:hypothetical protein ACTFBT_16265 [Streptomyces microflavus]|uniref:hypothetical protein n=1 Tax=Streptomyces TaxID=1883 RepID=UPI000517941B|nr:MULTISPECIES: hypothetical protein [Streptomyces]MDX2981241.1 hypothetical protein [Streptomyces sp. NRRL_B-2249]
MPEPLLFLLLAVLLSAAVHCLANASKRRPVPPPPTPERAPAPVHMAACHNIRCGAHNRTPHRATEDGLVCEDCGQLTPRTP